MPWRTTVYTHVGFDPHYWGTPGQPELFVDCRGLTRPGAFAQIRNTGNVWKVKVRVQPHGQRFEKTFISNVFWEIFTASPMQLFQAPDVGSQLDLGVFSTFHLLPHSQAISGLCGHQIQAPFLLK